MSNIEERLFNELYNDIIKNGKKLDTYLFNQFLKKDIYAIEYPNGAIGLNIYGIFSAVNEKGSIVYVQGTKENLAEISYEYFHSN